ncbi:transposase domain-containing protein [Micromonospora sp. NPDC049102]|uniref:transposase domain-containing protein n=1 Tax=Micromonospora sp. NPDC049102 TaxID=3364265 RepID=UPI00372492F9
MEGAAPIRPDHGPASDGSPAAERPVLSASAGRPGALTHGLEETGTREKRLRLLPSRVVVYFVLTLALFERCSYRATWGKLTASLAQLSLARPSVSSLARARRRIGVAPLRRLFETLTGGVGQPGQPGVFYRGLRTVAIDGTHLHVPDADQVTWRYRKRAGHRREFGYPLLRLLMVIEYGTRTLLATAFGPDEGRELPYAHRLVGALDRTMLLLADAGFDAAQFLRDVRATGAQFLIRSTACRRPTITDHLPDGSYLTHIGTGRYPCSCPCGSSKRRSPSPSPTARHAASNGG